MLGSQARLIGGLSFTVVFVLGCWVIAGLIWDFHLPVQATFVDLPRKPATVADKFEHSMMFGGSAAGDKPQLAEAEAALRLLGVLHTANAETTRAIVLRDGETRPQVIALGSAIDGDTLVKRIAARQVFLTTHGREILLNLPEQAAASPTPRLVTESPATPPEAQRASSPVFPPAPSAPHEF